MVLFGPFIHVQSSSLLFGPVWSYSVLFGPFSLLVHVQSYSVLLYLIRSCSVHSFVFNPIRSYSVLFGLNQFCSVLFGPLGPLSSYSVLFSPFSPLRSYSVHSLIFGPILSYSVLFDLIRSFSVHSVLFGPFQSFSVLFDLIWSCLVLFSLIRSSLVLIGSIPSITIHFVFLAALHKRKKIWGFSRRSFLGVVTMENCNIQNKDIVAMSILASHAYDDEIVFIPKGDIIIFVASHQSWIFLYSLQC